MTKPSACCAVAFNLKTLNLSSNPLGPDGLKVLVASLTGANKARSSSTSRARREPLSDCGIQTLGLREIGAKGSFVVIYRGTHDTKCVPRGGEPAIQKYVIQRLNANGKRHQICVAIQAERACFVCVLFCAQNTQSVTIDD